MKRIKIRSAKKKSMPPAPGDLDPDNPTLSEEYYRLAYDLHRRGHIDDAIARYREALRLNPKHAMALYNFGAALHAKNRLDEAVSLYQKALISDPKMIGAYYNLGTIFQARKQLDEAIICYEKVLELNSGLTDPYYNLGLAYQEQGRQQEAFKAYEKALQLDPSFISARWAKCIAQIPAICQDGSAVEAARDNYRDELERFRETVPLNTAKEVDAAAQAIGRQQPFFLAYQGLNDRELQRLYGEIVFKIMSSRYPLFAQSPPAPEVSRDEPLRIGIASGFFYYHAVWKIPIKGWIENLDKKRFRLYGYYTGHKKDEATEIARKYCSRFVEGIQSFEGLCETIRQDRLHLLIYPEIGMDPATVKLAALRLAPVQCATWGHPETSGLPTIDYFLSGDRMEPEDADSHYTERLVRLPNLSIYYTPPEIRRAEISRETLGLRPGSTLYHCCQALYKFSPKYDEMFPRIAQEVGDCQFLFVCYPNIGRIVEQFRLRISRAFSRFDMKIEDHVIFLPPLPPDWYQALNSISDVYLDTPGWSGCNSILEALSSDLPVVTLPSPLMRGREGFAILSIMGVTETIAATVDEYVTKAVTLGKDAEYRQAISNKIAITKHLVYRDMECIRALESFLMSACQNKSGAESL